MRCYAMSSTPTNITWRARTFIYMYSRNNKQIQRRYVCVVEDVRASSSLCVLTIRWCIFVIVGEKEISQCVNVEK